MIVKRLTSLAITLTSFVAGVFAQTHGTEAHDHTPAVHRHGEAWTLSYPLGMRFESTIDTMPHNYQRHDIPSMVSDAYATTGNLGAEGLNQIYFDRPQRSTFFFNDALHAWLPSFANRKLYNVYVPTTIVSYDLGGSRDTNQDRLSGIFAGNVNRRIGIGAFGDYLYSKGSYANQATKDLAYGFSGYYTGDRYEAQAFVYQYNFLNKENGGITDDLYITDPAQLQGGVTKIEPKSIPTNLTGAHTRLRGTEFFMTHAYKVGFWKDVQVNDTLRRQEYVPVTKFIYSLDFRRGTHIFKNTVASEAAKMWNNRCYMDRDGTYDKTGYWSLANSLGISMIEGFQNWAKFGLSAYATYETRRFNQATKGWAPPIPDEEGNVTQLTPWPEGVNVKPSDSQNLLWLGGSITKQQGAVLRYNADARFGIAGDVAGDVDINGQIETNLRMLGDTVRVAAQGFFRNVDQPYLLKHYVSNHFAWDWNPGKTRSFRAGGTLTIPWTRTELSVGWENMQNYVYFDTEGTPSQHGGMIHIFAASLSQRLSAGIWNWDNRITFQSSSHQDVLPLPAIALYTNMYLHFKAFKVLDLQIGADCDYYTRYRGVNYEPATMAFRVGEDWKVGNFPFMNVYVNAKLYKVRFFLLFSHFNSGWFTKEYFSMPHYPVNPSRFLMGLSVDFAN